MVNSTPGRGLIEQLANVGSEIERALEWADKGKHNQSSRAPPCYFYQFALAAATAKERRGPQGPTPRPTWGDDS